MKALPPSRLFNMRVSQAFYRELTKRARADERTRSDYIRHQLYRVWVTEDATTKEAK
jgi:hypothetical protein